MHTLEFEKETINPGGDFERADLVRGEMSEDNAKEEDEQMLTPTYNVNITKNLEQR